MSNQKLFTYPFAKIYPMYIAKAEKKERTKKEVDQIIFWLTGYDEESLQESIVQETTLEDFFKRAPQINPNSSLIKGTICGCKVEEIKDKTYQNIRYLDKLIDELAKGKELDEILRKEQ